MSRDSELFDRANLPPWLRDVTLPPRPHTAALAPAAQQDDIPDWLRPAASPPPSTAPAPAPVSPPANDIPDWLRPAASPPPSAAPAPASVSPPADDIPDWLRPAASPPPSAAPAPAPVSPPANDIPDWLRPLGDAPAPAVPAPSHPQPTPPTADMPDWLRPMAPQERTNEPDDWFAGYDKEESSVDTSPSWLAPAQGTQHDDGGEAKDMPDWLREIVAQGPAQPEPVQPAPQPSETGEPATASWLRDLAPGSADQPTPPAPPHEETPAWLSAAPPAVPAPSQGVDADLLPQGIEPFSFGDEPGIQPFAPPVEEQRPGARPTGDVPRWLQAEESGAESEEVPAWLRATDTSASPPDAPPAADAEAIPDWLRDEPPGADAPPAAGAEAIPDWLRDEPPGAGAPPAAGAEAIPDWLRDEPPSSDAPPAVDAEAIPDWLRDEPPSSDAVGETLPPWMQETSSADPWQQAASERSDEHKPLPEWLRELPADDEPSASSPPAPPTGSDAPSGESLPPWLSSDVSDLALKDSAPVGEPPAAAVPPKPSYSPPPASSGALPSWLRDVSTEQSGQGDPGLPAWLSDAPIEQPVAPAPSRSEQAAADISAHTPDAAPSWAQGYDERPAPAGGDMLGGTDLPAWLRVEANEAPSQEEQSENRALDWLARLRLQDEEAETIAAAPAVTMVPRPQVMRRPVPPEALALLQQLTAEPFPRPVAEPAAAPARWQRPALIERALALLLLLGVLIAILLPSIGAQFAAPAIPTPSVTRLHDLIDSLGPSDVVLLAYEWDARRSAELAPLERGVAEHLTARKAAILALSTDPQGALLSFDLRDRLRAAGYGVVQNRDGQPEIVGGVDDLFLGYLPGGEIALRGLSQNFGARVSRDFAGNDTSQSVFVTGVTKNRPPLTSLDQVKLIVVMADEPQDIQGWLEQVHGRAPAVPMALVTPTELGPYVQPYLTNTTLMPLIGQPDALAYSGLINVAVPGADVQLRELVGARNLGLVVFVVLVLGGVGAAVVRRR